MSSTRKIRLSKKLTLRLQYSPMLIQEAPDDDQQSQEEPRHLAFQNLPDLLPELFGLETDSPALNDRFSNRTYSTYQVWESTSDLKSRHRAAKLSFNESQAGNGGTDNNISVRNDDVAHSKHKIHQVLEDVENTFTSTPPFKIENLRHIVRAYPPRGCDIDEFEKDNFEFENISITAGHSFQDNNWSMQVLDQLNDFTAETESLKVESHDGSDDEDSIDSYAILQDYVTHKSSPPSHVMDDETSKFSSRSSNSEVHQDFLQLSNDKHRRLRKTVSRKRMVKDQIDICSSTVDHTPSKIRRQKRSNIRRRRPPAGSSNQSGNDQELRWYSMTGHSDTEHNVDGRHITGCRTKKLKRKSTASVAVVKKVTSNSKAVHTAKYSLEILAVNQLTE